MRKPYAFLKRSFALAFNPSTIPALYCFFALLLLAILRLELREAGITTRVGHAVQRLAKIQEAVVVYTNGAVDRVLTDMDDTQSELARALGIDDLADALGTTMLSAD